MTMVVLYGPPSVKTNTVLMSLKALAIASMRMIFKIGPIMGMVMYQSCFHPLAPSMVALSRVSLGICWSPAMK